MWCIPLQLLQVVLESKCDLVKALAPVVEEKVDHGPHGGRFKSVSKRFNTQLGNLMATLNSTASNFIRCIKPNHEKKSWVIDRHSVLTQLQYSGMCAALLLMQAGYPTRYAFDVLYDRYAKLMPAMLRKLKPITFCEALLVALDLQGGKDFQIGKRT